MFKKDAKLSPALATPTLSVSDKQQIVQELSKHIGHQDKDGVVKNFLSTLAENNRLGVLEHVVEKFAVLMGAARGEVELTVTSAAVSSCLLPSAWAIILGIFNRVGYGCATNRGPNHSVAMTR